MPGEKQSRCQGDESAKVCTNARAAERMLIHRKRLVMRWLQRSDLLIDTRICWLFTQCRWRGNAYVFDYFGTQSIRICLQRRVNKFHFLRTENWWEYAWPNLLLGYPTFYVSTRSCVC